MRQGEELRSDQATMRWRALAGASGWCPLRLPRLRVIEVNFGEARGCDILRQEFVAADYRQPHVGQASLVRPPRGITDHDRQDFDADVIDLRPRQRTGNHKPPVPAAD